MPSWLQLEKSQELCLLDPFHAKNVSKPRFYDRSNKQNPVHVYET